MAHNKSTKVNFLIDEARLHLNETHTLLHALRQLAIDLDKNSCSDEDRILTVQLVLQYRLSCEDALSILLTMDHNLLYFLGIQRQHSPRINKERLAYAIGNEDLKHILNVLAILTGSLAKILARYKNNHASFALSQPKKQHSIIKRTQLLLNQQKQFLNTVHQLDLEIGQLLKQQAAGPVFDHIAALRGPISQFYQAVLNGLEQTKDLYEQVNKVPVLDYQLNALLKETTKVLQSLPSSYNPQPSYTLKQFDHSMTTEQLEQRAAAKRLRPFFG